MSTKPVFLVTGADLAPEALALLGDYEVVYSGKTPTEEGLVALCRQHNPVAIIVRCTVEPAHAFRFLGQGNAQEH